MKTFYKIREKRIQAQKDIMNHAKELCESWFVDKLNAIESFKRKNADMSFEEVMEHFTEDSLPVFIHVQEGTHEPGIIESYIDVGFRTNTTDEKGNEYFLFIKVNEEHLDMLTQYYKLEQIETGSLQ